MRDLLSDYDRLAALGRPVGRAVVTSVWGSAPRPEGSSMLATADGTMAGSVSGGCVEGATATEIAEAIGRGTPKLVTFGVTHERAWEVGLACGGTIKVFVEPTRASGGAYGRARTRRRRGGHAGRRTGGRSLGHRASRTAGWRAAWGTASRMARSATPRSPRWGTRQARREASRPSTVRPICSSRCSHASRAWSSSAASTSRWRWCRWRERSAIARSSPTAGRRSSPASASPTPTS